MKRDDLFPSKYLKCADLKGIPRTVRIKHASVETLKNTKGEEQRKVVLYLAGTKKALPLNLTNYDSVAAIAGDEETNNWSGVHLELFPSTTALGGKMVDCIRVRKPQEGVSPAPPPEKTTLKDDLNDDIPW
jgi:hypothetical protein